MHLASPASPPEFLRRPLDTLFANSTGTHNLLELARRIGARFFLASTSEIYGDPLVHPQPETYWGNVNPNGERSVYDESKRFAESITMAYHRQFDLDVRIVRIFNTYGPRMQADDGRVVTNFINQALAGDPITIYGDGTQTRSFCYVDDEIRGFLALLDSEHIGPINIGNPNEFTMRELAELVTELDRHDVGDRARAAPADDPRDPTPGHHARHATCWAGHRRSSSARAWPGRSTGSARNLAGLMERFGLVGLPNAGKSSLYNALTGGGALAAPYPFATKDPNIGVAKVPDDRVDHLAAMSKSKNIIHAQVEVVDIGGLVEGASKGEGLGNKFLANIREVDAIVFVLRAFEDDDVVGSPDPIEHLRVGRAGTRAGRPRSGREAPEPGHPPVEARQDARRRDRRAPGRVRRAQRRATALPRRAVGRRQGDRSRPTSCSPTGGSSPWSTSARTRSTRSRPPRRGSPPSSTTPATTSR